MRTLVIAIGTLAMLVGTAGRARAQLCSDWAQPVVVRVGYPVRPPVGFIATRVTVQLGRSSPERRFDLAVGPPWTPALAELESVEPAGQHTLRWTDSTNRTLCQRIELAASDPILPRPTGGADRCREAGALWRDTLVAEGKRDGGFTVLVFLENGSLCYSNRDFGVVGDPIYVGLYAYDPSAWQPARFEPCSIEPEGPQVYVPAGSLGDVRSLGTPPLDTPVLITTSPRRCYNQAVDIVFRGSSTTSPVERRWTLNQVRRYHATLQLGVLFPSLHRRSYALRPDSPLARVYNQGPVDRGPEYVAVVTVYSLIRQIKGLIRPSRRFEGRDIVHERGWEDVLGAFVGVGLSNPSQRFVTGLSVEALTGISGVVGVDVARVNELAGVAEGDAFTGSADQIPTRDRWRTALAWGVSLDLRYVTALFSHK